MHAEISSEQSEISISIILIRTICKKHGKSKTDSTSNTLSYGLYYLHHLCLISQYFHVPLKLKLGLRKIRSFAWMSSLNCYLRCKMVTSEFCIQCHSIIKTKCRVFLVINTNTTT